MATRYLEPLEDVVVAWTLAQAKEHLEEIAERASKDEPQRVQIGDTDVTVIATDALRTAPLRSELSERPRPRLSMREVLDLLPTLSADEFALLKSPWRDHAF